MLAIPVHKSLGRLLGHLNRPCQPRCVRFAHVTGSTPVLRRYSEKDKLYLMAHACAYNSLCTSYVQAALGDILRSLQRAATGDRMHALCSRSRFESLRWSKDGVYWVPQDIADTYDPVDRMFPDTSVQVLWPEGSQPMGGTNPCSELLARTHTRVCAHRHGWMDVFAVRLMWSRSAWLCVWAGAHKPSGREQQHSRLL